MKQHNNTPQGTSKTIRSFLFSFMMHAVIVFALFFGWHLHKNHQQTPKSSPVTKPTINAHAVSSVEVNQQIAKLKHEQLAHQAHLKKLRDDATKAKRERKAEQARLIKIKHQRQVEKQKLIALKHKRAVEAARARKLAKQRALAVKRKAQHRQRMQNELAKHMAAEQKDLAENRARHLQSLLQRYTGLIQQAIGQHWLVPDNAEHKSCKLLIRLAPGGEVLKVSLITSSGDPALDSSAQVAVMKASPLPVPDNADLFEKFRVLRLTVRPEQINT